MTRMVVVTLVVGVIVMLATVWVASAQQRQTCTSTRIGNTVFTQCY